MSVVQKKIISFSLLVILAVPEIKVSGGDFQIGMIDII